MIRFGILGFGAHAVKRVMPAFANTLHGKVTALSRRNLADAQASARRYNIANAFDSAEALCASPEVDAVFIASPDAHHLPDALLAIRHGKPVLCEKPMAMNAVEARQMVEAARSRGVLLGVAHVFRFEDSVRRLRQIVAEGMIGKPLFAHAEFCYPGHLSPRKWLRNAALSCGGPIGDVGAHCIDALRFILADEVESVFTAALYEDASSPLEASATMSLKWRKGTLGTVSVSIQGGYGTPVEIVGERGSVRAHNGLTVDRPIEMIVEVAGSKNDAQNKNARTQDTTTHESFFNNMAYVRQFDSFARAVEGGEEFPCPGEVGLRNQLVLDAAFLSAKTGLPQTVLPA